MTSDESDRFAIQASAGPRLELIAESFARFFERPLVESAPCGLEKALWEAPRAIVAHGTEVEPLFFYGNRLALELFGLRADAFIGLASYSSAEPSEREERARMLEGLRLRGFLEDYSSVRVSTSGQRFAITNTQVWNLVDRDGEHHGQAATFSEWRLL